MTEIPMNHPLVQRIAQLRTRARILLSLQGLGIVLAALAGGLLVFALADYILHFYPLARLVLALAGIMGLGWLAFRRWLRPLATPLTDQFLASRVELVQKPLADELISALSFISHGLLEKNVLAARAVDQVSSTAANLSFESALSYRLATRTLGLGTLLTLMLVGAAALAPSMASIAWSRWTDPFGGHTWPRVTHVAFVWPNGGKPPAVHPVGEPLTIRAEVTKGHTSGLRAFLYTTIDSQNSVRELMNFQEAQSDKVKGVYLYEKRLEPVGESQLSLQLVARDDNEQNPIRIRLAPRPELAGLKAEVLPPAYVSTAPATASTSAPGTGPAATGSVRNFDLLSELGRAVEGSTVRLLIRSSKPLAVENYRPVVRLLQAERDVELPLRQPQRHLIDANTALLSFQAQQPIDFRVQMRDSDGFENRVTSTVRLDVVPDALPTVAITEPRRPLEVIADAVVPVELQASDDLGLSDILLQADNFDAKPGDLPRFRQPLEWAGQTADPASLSVTGMANFTWNLTTLNLKPGERLSYYGLVRDSFRVPPEQFAGGKGGVKDPYEFESAAQAYVRHRYVKSAPLSLLIATKERIEEAARKELQDVRDQIRNLVDQQSLTNQQTRAIQKAVQDAGRSTQQQQQQLAELAGQQAAEAQRALAIKARTDQISQGLDINRMAESELGQISKDVSNGMKDVGQKNMPKAASELSTAQDSAAKAAAQKQQEQQAAQDTAAAAERAGAQQEMAMSTMNKLLDRLGAAGDLEAHRSKVNEILDKQKELEKRLRDQAAKTLGTPLDQLPPGDKKSLEGISKDQNKLANDVSKLTDAMEKSADQLSKSDPAASESLSKAAQSSRSNNVAGNQAGAAQAAQSNQMSSASSSMSNARKGLEEMKDELDQQNRRQLEQLARQVQELLDSLVQLRAKQLVINDETTKAEAAAGRDLLEPLGNRQSRLQGNVLAETQRAEALKNGRPIALDLRDASDAMGAATTALIKTTQAEALDPEKDALAALDRAIEKLQKQKKELADKLKEEDLASFRRKYEAIQKDQLQIKTVTDQIAARLAGKEPDRGDLATLGKQAGAQNQLQEAVTQLSENKELAKYDVLVWINQQIVENMLDSKNRLSKAQIGKPLAQVQQTALDRLQDIIDALKEEQGKKDPFAGGGGGGGGGGGKKPLLPPAAQLKLLKSQQTIVNRTTVDVNKQLEQSATETDKRQLKQQVQQLGKKQDKIKELATKVVDEMKQ